MKPGTFTAWVVICVISVVTVVLSGLKTESTDSSNWMLWALLCAFVSLVAFVGAAVLIFLAWKHRAEASKLPTAALAIGACTIFFMIILWCAGFESGGGFMLIYEIIK